MRLLPIYMLPGFLSLFWAIVHHMIARKSSTYRVLMPLIIAVAITALGDLVVAEMFGSKAVAHLIVQFMAPAIIPLSCLYFSHLWKGYRHRPIQMLWIVFPVMLFTAGLILTGALGFHQTEALLDRVIAGEKGAALYLNGMEHAYYAWTFIIFRIVLAAEAVFMLVYIFYLGIQANIKLSHFRDFLLYRRRIRLLEIQVVLAFFILCGLCIKIFLHPVLLRSQLLTYALVLIVSGFEFLFYFFGLFGAREFISLPDIASGFRFNYNRDSAAQNAADVIMDMMPMLQGDALTQVISRLEMQAGAENPGRNIGKNKAVSLSSSLKGGNPGTRDEADLLARFQHLMMEEQLFLQPSVTLADVSERLHSNKTYVSRMVNQNYDMGFPEVLNILRVDYAEHYIRKHPEANQEDIARACGFLSASSFNATFKRITGLTPKVWAAHLITNN